MIRRLSALLAIASIFCACAPLNHRDRDFLQSHGVSGPLYEKMLHHEPLTLDEIVTLSQQGMPGRFIVHYLRPTYAVYNLSMADIQRLRQAHVEDGLIRYLAATPAMFSPGGVPLPYQDEPLDHGYHQDYPRF